MLTLAPIMFWYIMAIMYQNDGYINVYALTYIFQFIVCAVNSIFIRASIKDERLKGAGNSGTITGIFIGFIILVIIIVAAGTGFIYVSDIFKVKYEYKDIFIFNITIQSLDYLIYGYKIVQQYRGIKVGGDILAYYLIRINSIIVARCMSENRYIAYFMIVITSIAIIAYKYIKIMGSYTIKINKPILKYSINDVSKQVIAIMIYTLVNNRIAQSDSFLRAYSTLATCTDTQWDISNSGIDTYISTNFCNGNVKKRYIYNCIAYGIILVISSVILTEIVIHLDSSIQKEYTIQMLLLENILFPYHSFMCALVSIMTMQGKGYKIMKLSIIGCTARLYATYTIKSPYSPSIGCMVEVGLSTTLIILLYISENRKSKARSM